MGQVLFFEPIWILLAIALLGLAVWTVSGVAANAQGHGLNISSVAGISSSSWHDEHNDEPPVEEMAFDIEIEIEEEATVTFINKTGEVEAVLKGNRTVLDKFNLERLDKSYLLGSYGIHQVYPLTLFSMIDIHRAVHNTPAGVGYGTVRLKKEVFLFIMAIDMKIVGIRIPCN